MTAVSTEQPAAHVAVTNLCKAFPTRADPLRVLHEVSLELACGEALVIMGPSGSGKSTLLNILGTLEPPSAGEVRIDETDPFALEENALATFRNRRIGFVFQEHHLLGPCSVLENVLIPTLAGDSRDGAGAEARGRALLDQVGLSGRLDHRPAELSGGERQRTALARALINQPALLLCDEPTGNLDRTTANEVAELLVELHAEQRITLVVVTHSLDLGRRFDRRVELDGGTLRPSG